MSPLVSIIIPTYNRARLIGETLDSILAQTYTNWECIVVDDGSTDSTFEVLSSYCKKDSRIKYYQRPISLPKGANTCRNYGFKLCEGKFVNWFDDDDIMLEDFITFKVNTIKEMDVVVTSGIVVDANKKYIKEFRFNDVYNLYKQYALTKTEMITNSVMFNKKFLIGERLFDPKIKRGQEADFFLRMFLQVDDSMYKVTNFKSFMYRQHENTKSHRGQSYVKAYKKSQAHIYIENFNVSITLKDKDLFYGYYLALLILLFDAAEVRDFANYKYILKNFYVIISKKNPLKFCIIFLVTFLLFVLGRRSYFLEKKLRYFNVKMP